MNKALDDLRDLFIKLGTPEDWAVIFREGIAIAFILILAVISYYVTRIILFHTVYKVARRTKSEWDDILIRKKVFRRLAFLAPALVINYLSPILLGEYAFVARIIEIVTAIYMVVVTVRVFLSIADAFHDIYSIADTGKGKPIKGYVQVFKIVLYIISGIIIISILLGKQNFGWLAGLGAFSAVLMLIFKDPILGFVGGIQLSANNMVRLGDWIEMPKYGADGTVIDISLTTVKVQNWDKTITTIPTYTLVTDSFRNWRGMEESGGRRIKRSINIDMTSIKFCTPEMLERFSQFQHVAEYVRKTEKDIQEYNKRYDVDNSVLVNGRRQTNIGVFRAYLRGYLSRNPKINQKMTFLVRQLQPTDKGLPIEIYVFSKVQEWAKYEDLQSDIFDHVLAVIPFFELKVFQDPTGSDFQHLTGDK
ncbi:MAG: mechanosensitive ion channel family protein [Bacteroidetes bacterium]|nr:mechanosensitive ion channel family protein [Bacteroidota bacterium]